MMFCDPNKFNFDYVDRLNKPKKKKKNFDENFYGQK